MLVLTTYDTDSDVVPALEAGATGYLLKDAPRERARPRHPGGGARRGGARPVGRDAARQPAPRARRTDALSDRELEVLTLIAQGETNRGAAARLFISEATVKTHLLHIYAKLGVNDRAAAVAPATSAASWCPVRADIQGRIGHSTALGDNASVQECGRRPL